MAITGTNGKSTTTALIAHLFRSFGFAVEIGGNIGTPILALARRRERVHVVECSSFQIALAPSLNPSVAVLLNITPDHLDRHGTMENYAAIKAKLVENADLAVIEIDDNLTSGIAGDRMKAGRKTVCVSVTKTAIEDGIVLDGDCLMRRGGGRSTRIAGLAGIASLRGQHNGQNAAAAVAGSSRADLISSASRKACEVFPDYRIVWRKWAGKGRFSSSMNSKATNADAAEKALLSFDKVFWIIGGRAKEAALNLCAPCSAKSSRLI